MMNSKPFDTLYSIKKDVVCLHCGNHGAVQKYAEWYPHGLGEQVKDSRFLHPYQEKPFMNYFGGFGGTKPWECLGCGDIGLIDQDGLEGFKLAFYTVREESLHE